MEQVEVHFGAASDVGRVRSVNEDSHLAAPPVFVVADGMGGHSGGDVASRIVVEEFGRLDQGSYTPAAARTAVYDALVAAQQRINAYADEHRRAGAVNWFAGTTAVAAVLVDHGGPRWLVANLGDSRAYRLVGDSLEQVSVDHSVVQELVEAGAITVAEMATHPERHVVTRALGGSDAAEPDFFLLDRCDRLLLCSDGITGMLSDDEVAAVLRSETSAGDAADRLVAEAVRAGGLDNATAVVADVVGWEPAGAADVPRQVSLEEKLGALPDAQR
jgi:protein phosphatase